MNARRKFLWTVIWALIGLAVVSTTTYALYNLFFDPGLQAVQDAGLGTKPELTALPTLLPTPTAIPTQIPLDEWTQSKNGVTLRLDSLSLSEMGTRMEFTVYGLTIGRSLDLPQVKYIGAQIEQERGKSLSLVQQGDALAGTFVSYQILRQGVVNHQVDVAISIPLLGQDGQPLTTFDYSLMAVPVSQVQLPGQQTYSVRYNGQELTVPQVVISPQTTRALVCLEDALNPSAWKVSQAGLAWLDNTGQPTQPAITDFIAAAGQDDCYFLTFETPKRTDEGVLQLAIHEIVDSEGNTRAGQWEFYVDLPGSNSTSSSMAPLAAETIANLTATLHWAYADTNRAAFEVKFENWQPEYALGNILGTDAEGNPLGYGYGIPVNSDDASLAIILFTPDNPAYWQGDQVELNLEIQVIADPKFTTPMAAFHFNLDLPVYPGLTIEPASSVTTNGIEMRLEKIVMSPSYSQVTLCYQKPTHTGNSDWGIFYNNVSLHLGNYTVPMDQYVLLADADYEMKKPGGFQLPEGMGRCVEIGFPIGHRNQAAPSTFKLSIPSLQLSIPEMIADADIAAANQKLAAEGLEFSYSVSSNSNGGAAGPVILKKPDAMSDTDAINRLYAALGYVCPGPWEFELTVTP